MTVASVGEQHGSSRSASVGNDRATSSKQVHSGGEPGSDGASSPRCSHVAVLGNDGAASSKQAYRMESLEVMEHHHPSIYMQVFGS